MSVDKYFVTSIITICLAFCLCFCYCEYQNNRNRIIIPDETEINNSRDIETGLAPIIEGFLIIMPDNSVMAGIKQ